MTEQAVEVTDEDLREELKRFLVKVVREADKEYLQSVPCEKCPGFKHRVTFTVPDIRARLDAAQQLLDRLEGRPGQQRVKEPVRTFDVGDLDGLSDAELAVLVQGGEVEDGEAEGIDEGPAA